MNAHSSAQREAFQWRDAMRNLIDPRSVTMLCLGLSAGLPLLLIFSTLSLWLREAGVERSAVTFFSWAALGYSFKFVWAPLVDKLPLPLLSRLMGRRRSWLLFSQCLIVLSVLAMGLIDPAKSELALVQMAFAAVALGFSSATQDICIDAFRIESAEKRFQAFLAAVYVAGYRIGMLISGAGALALASYFGSEMGQYSYQAWRWAYFVMAGFMGIGVLTVLVRPEPEVAGSSYAHSASEYFKLFLLFLCGVVVFVVAYIQMDVFRTDVAASWAVGGVNASLVSFLMATFSLLTSASLAASFCWLLAKSQWVNPDLLTESYVGPVKNFFQVNGARLALLFLAVIGLYRISDILLGVIANVFYQDLGFTKDQIAFVVKTFGLGMTLLGGFLGGLLTARYGIYRILLWGAILAALTNLLFMFFAFIGPVEWMLYVVISADNLAGGVAVAAFVAYLSSLTNVSYTAVQYAIFSSLMTLVPKLLGGYSGSMVDAMGYANYFALTAVIGVPIVILITRIKHHIQD